jgi:hypothetical protein
LSDWKDNARKEKHETDGPDEVEESLSIRGIKN